MRFRALGAVLVAMLLLVACRRTPPAVPASPEAVGRFAIVLERSVTGWAAHCESGCRWTDVSLSCPQCDVRLDASGITRAYPAAEPPVGFAFILSAEKRGWSARAIQGVEWERLSWTCTTGVCHGRLDQSGVSGA